MQVTFVVASSTRVLLITTLEPPKGFRRHLLADTTRGC